MAAEWEALFEDFQQDVCYQRAEFQFLTLLSTVDTYVHICIWILYSSWHCCASGHILPQAFIQAIITCVICTYYTLIGKSPKWSRKGDKRRYSDVCFFTGCTLSKVIFIVSFVGLIVENHMFKTIGPVPKQCTTLERASNLHRPDLKFICKRRAGGVLTAAMPCFSLKNSPCFFISLRLVLDLPYGWGTDSGSKASLCIDVVSFLLSYFLGIEQGTVVIVRKSKGYPRNTRIISLCFRFHHLSVKIIFCLFLSTFFLAFRLYKAWSTTPEGSRNTDTHVCGGAFLHLQVMRVLFVSGWHTYFND